MAALTECTVLSSHNCSEHIPHDLSARKFPGLSKTCAVALIAFYVDNLVKDRKTILKIQTIAIHIGSELSYYANT